MIIAALVRRFKWVAGILNERAVYLLRVGGFLWSRSFAGAAPDADV